jgi:hypothetical protein
VNPDTVGCVQIDREGPFGVTETSLEKQRGPGRGLPLRGRLAIGMSTLLVATAVWLPTLHLFYSGHTDRYFAPRGVGPQAQRLAETHFELWTNPDRRQVEIEKMRLRNPEWDFIDRSFFVWSLANIALRDPASRARCLSVMDLIIDETLRFERVEGLYYFSMQYAREGRFLVNPQRSQFIDGEVALMLACRRFVEEKAEYKPLLAERTRLMLERMRKSKVLCAESYPDECWLFCNTVALAAMRIEDDLDATDHSAFFREWVAVARASLIDPKTGLLFSSFNLDGHVRDGPEGSSIWMAAHCLQLIDEDFAFDQYVRAKNQLARQVLGFGYAREWPRSWPERLDVDSGPVIPFLEAAPASSGLAFVAARSFDDREYLTSLLATLRLAGFPVERGGTLRFAASNQVGDSVLLYATVLGPIWQKVRERMQSKRGGLST